MNSNNTSPSRNDSGPIGDATINNNSHSGEEDPTTPKTIHMTRNPIGSTNTNNSSLYLSSNVFQNSDSRDSNSNRNTDSNPFSATGPPPRLSLQSTNDSSNQNHDNNTEPTATSTSTSTSSLTRLQRSIPVHSRTHAAGTGFISVTSSTRSVKSIGSSIMDDVDTEEDDEEKSNSGLLSLMSSSQDYIVGGEERGGVNRRMKSHYEGSGVGGDDTSMMQDDDHEGADKNDNEEENSVEYNEHEHGTNVRSGVKKTGKTIPFTSTSAASGFAMTANIMEKYFRQMQLNLEKGLREMKEQNRRDHERVLATLQNETNRRIALEGRLHAQILLQSETLIAMEVKLLKLEAKVEKREAALRSRKNMYVHNNNNMHTTSSLNAAGGLDSGSQGGSGGAVSGSNNIHQRSGAFSSYNHDRSGSISIGANSGFGGQTSFGLENDTIEEEDVFDMTEIRFNHNESQSRFLRGSGSATGVGGGGSTTGGGGNSRVQGGGSNPTNILAVISSGASLASGVTMEGHDEHTQEGDDGASGRSGDGDVEDEGDNVEEDASPSTPTQGSRSHFTNLESILLNPIQSSGSNEHALSTRAVRGEYDGNSSLATSVTNTTVASTIITATTGGGGLELANSASVSQRGEDIDSMLGLSPPTATEIRPSRSRSQSPLTVHSAATASVGPQSAASVGTVGTSIISTAAVAPARSFRARRDAAARMGNVTMGDGGRQITNRVVSFTSNEVLELPPEISEAGDSITMPDELDNLSDVADVLADRGRIWRDEYEARLDAIQKRFNGE